MLVDVGYYSLFAVVLLAVWAIGAFLAGGVLHDQDWVRSGRRALYAVFGLSAAVYEMHPDVYLPETKPRDVTSAGNSQSLLRPVALEPDTAAPQPLVYRWTEVEPALARMAATETTSPYDGVAIEYAGPNNGHALRTDKEHKGSCHDDQPSYGHQ